MKFGAAGNEGRWTAVVILACCMASLFACSGNENKGGLAEGQGSFTVEDGQNDCEAAAGNRITCVPAAVDIKQISAGSDDAGNILITVEVGGDGYSFALLRLVCSL